MELQELQAMWQQYDKNLSENTKINKEILKHILLSKPEKRINREKIKVGISLTLPFVLILLVLSISDVPFRSSIDFYIGALMFLGLSSLTYYWRVRYFMLICKVDFSKPIVSIKKELNQLQKYKIMLKKYGYILSPIGMIGIFMMIKFPIFSTESILPLFLIAMTMLVSIYYTFKYSISEQFRKLDKEMEELEDIESK